MKLKWNRDIKGNVYTTTATVAELGSGVLDATEEQEMLENYNLYVDLNESLFDDFVIPVRKVIEINENFTISYSVDARKFDDEADVITKVKAFEGAVNKAVNTMITKYTSQYNNTRDFEGESEITLPSASVGVIEETPSTSSGTDTDVTD